MGPMGPAGPMGAPGAKGENGATGATGPAGSLLERPVQLGPRGQLAARVIRGRKGLQDRAAPALTPRSWGRLRALPPRPTPARP
jgi:hypothetical protein